MRSLLIVLLALLPQTTPVATRATVEGRVTRFNSETPIANVEIAIAGEGTKLEGAVSDADGRFVIEDVPPGAYTIRAERGGYIPPETNGVAIEDGGAAKNIRINAGQNRVTANVTLMPGAVIGGTVLDPDGRPAPQTQISAERISPNDGKTVTARTNNRGEYRLYALPPGTYRVFAAAAPEARGSQEPTGPRDSWVNTYFPGVADPGRALNIDLAEGAVRSYTDFTIQSERKFRVSGRLVFSSAGPADFKYPMFAHLIPASGRAGPGRDPFAPGRWDSRQEDDSYSFMIHAVRSGFYELYLRAGSISPDSWLVLGRAAIVVSDADVQNVRVEPGAIDVRGQILTMDSSVKRTGSIGLKLIEANVYSRAAKPDESGRFTIPGMVAGRWRVIARDLPENVAVFDVLQHGESIYENGFEVAGGTPESLQVMLSSAGSIEGTVRNLQQQPAAGAFVVLIPEAPNTSRAALYRQVQADGGGRFKITAVPTGSYSLFALATEAPDQRSPANAAAIQTFLAPFRSQGVTVNVSPQRTENRSIQLVDVGQAR